MFTKEKVLEISNGYLKNGFTSTISGAACSNFVTTVLQKAGWAHGIVNWIPDLVEGENYKKFELTKIPAGSRQAGDIATIDQLGDYVDPPGIGAEDTYCHIVFYIGNDQCIDYGGGLPGAGGHVRKLPMNHWGAVPIDYWRPKYDSETGGTPGSPAPKKLKVFVNKKGKKYVHDEKEYLMKDFILAAAGAGSPVIIESNRGNALAVGILGNLEIDITSISIEIDYTESG